MASQSQLIALLTYQIISDIGDQGDLATSSIHTLVACLVLAFTSDVVHLREEALISQRGIQDMVRVYIEKVQAALVPGALHCVACVVRRGPRVRAIRQTTICQLIQHAFVRKELQRRWDSMSSEAWQDRATHINSGGHVCFLPHESERLVGCLQGRVVASVLL